MCGITGFINPGRSQNADAMEAITSKMTDTLWRRGPDDRGVWLDVNAGIALGHRRLSIFDLSPEGHQPMISACKRYVMVYNGEIYNFKTLRAELEKAGHDFRGNSDTEVALAMISERGIENAVKRFIGMFAMALWDNNERRLHLVRDRMGKKPLYYGWMNGVFMFGSELKALRAHPDFNAELNRDALALYLRHNYVPERHSIYKNVYKLPPGSMLSLSGGDEMKMPEPVPYWTVAESSRSGLANMFDGSDDEAADELETLLKDVVKIRMEADVPLGAFLSGGIDSSMVVALMQAQSKLPVKTFSIGFHEESYNEAKHAKKVANYFGTDHTELYVTPEESMAVIPKLPELYDEPFADPSQIPTFLVSQLARKSVTVSLSGDGGDELFAGYNRYFWGRSIWKKIGWAPTGLRNAAAKTLTSISPQRWTTIFNAMGPVLPKDVRQFNAGDKLHKLAEALAVESPEALYLKLVSHWKEPESVVKNSSEPMTALTGNSDITFSDFTLKMMYLDMVTYLPDDILVKVDRASMGVSLEARTPLLDHRLVEFSWRIPLCMKIRNGEGKWLLRKVLHRYAPKELFDRPKMGFGVPIDNWLRGPLKDWAEELLDEKKLEEEGVFNKAPIREKWEEHLSGKRNWQYYLWDILMFQAWLGSGRL